MPQYWFIVEALLVLYERLKDSRKPFTRDNLRAWSEKFQQRPAGVQQALDHLERCGMVRRLPRAPAEKPLKPGMVRFALTAEGAAAASGAADARRRAALSSAGTKANRNRPRDAGAFITRLWALLRMRVTLSSAEAAATLVDAGEDVRKAATTASKYMRSWARLYPDAVQISKLRESGGGMRFVLVKDLGPTAPVIPNTRARGGAAA
jgi:hypothetical protein